MLIFFKGVSDKHSFVETVLCVGGFSQHCFSPHMKINHRLLNILRKVPSKKDQKSLRISEEAARLPLL